MVACETADIEVSVSIALVTRTDVVKYSQVKYTKDKRDLDLAKDVVK